MGTRYTKRLGEWSETLLSDVAVVNEATIDREYPNDVIEYIDIASVEKGRIVTKQVLKLSEAPSRAKRIVRDKDILISTVRPNLKHYCFVNRAQSNTVASTGFAVVTAKNADPYFLYSLLTTDYYTEYLTRIAEGHTSAYPSFNPDVIENSVFFMPALSEQTAIAAVLSSLDDKIELLRRQSETIENIAHTLFHEWFVEFNFPNQNGKPYKASGGKMIESEVGAIPEGWRVGTLEDLLSLEYGKALREDRRAGGQVAVYGSNGRVGWHNEKLVNGPGIVVGRKGNPGTVNWVDSDFFPIDTVFYVVPRNPSFDLHYLFYTLEEHDLSRFEADSAVPGLNRNHAYMSEQIIPNIHVIHEFARVTGSLFAKRRSNSKVTRTITTMRDTLLPKLISGELRVQGEAN